MVDSLGCDWPQILPIIGSRVGGHLPSESEFTPFNLA